MSSETQKKDKFLGAIVPLSIEKELKTSFLDYAMSVIISRALPDVRDGLKPVHRRILYAMHKLGLYNEKAYRKSATVVGEVMGNYHPHGDSAIYQSMVGLVQDFTKRYPLLDGQGNWGSIDGDNAAAMRYSEVRMAKIAKEILADIEKDTVLFMPNFDESKLEPTVLPSKIPNLLVNGSSGIAVGMATSIPPHNLGEVINAAMELLKNPNMSEDRLFELILAPDFPTGGLICGRSGIIKAYQTGHGKVILRGVIDVEGDEKDQKLVISQIPYQVNKSDLIKRIADLVKDHIIEGISNIRDESNKQGIRVVIDLKRGESANIILNQLYKHTALQSSISILLLALHNNKPTVFTLREMLEHFLVHRKEIVTRRTQFDLDKNKSREHLLHGLVIALSNIDAVVELIKKSKDAEIAIDLLNKKFQLTEAQGKAILDMKLQRLTGLEQEKIRIEIDELKVIIQKLELILSDPEELKRVIIEEFEIIKKTYSDPRKSVIQGAVDILDDADLISDEDVVVTLTQKGYIKRVILDTYSVQHRGGKGKKGMADLTDNEDIVQDLFVAKNHDELLFFTNLGRVYNLKVFQVPEGSRTSKGRAVVNLLPLTEGEKVVKLLSTREIDEKYLVMLTKKGVIKKTPGKAFAKIRSTGIRAVGLNENDELVFCGLSSGKDTIVIASKMGQGIRFNESEVRPMGRQAGGVRGIRVRPSDEVVGMEIVPATNEETHSLLFATENGYGKQVSVTDFRVAHRGGVGVRTIPTDKRNGSVIGLIQVSPEHNILLIDNNGKIIRLSPKEIRTMGRQAKGVRLVRLDTNQFLSTIAAFEESNDENSEKEAVAVKKIDTVVSSDESVTE
ncbi:DNA gyrase subunit A [Candidatus Dependentiae bacterium]|nr:DNA gyrase subunit A [Candidatus Dependentiae bacterium]MBU4387020.1 DNA gyrase subunit A [Candidatus Dependentiae bacterium]